MTRVSVASDLHLEFADVTLPGGDILILAGDIWLARDMRVGSANTELRARYARFATEELSKYQRVLVITGNHESYGSNIDDLNATLRVFLKTHAPNARLLHNETEMIGGVAFLGTPLWAGCGAGTDQEPHVASYMNDFRLIRTREPAPIGAAPRFVGVERVFTPQDAARMHSQAVLWLRDELPRYEHIVVIGHHAPSVRSGYKRGMGLDVAYVSDLDGLIKDSPQAAFWIHGHTHRAEDYMVSKTRVIANPRGYPTETTFRRFDATAKDFLLEDVIARTLVSDDRRAEAS